MCGDEFLVLRGDEQHTISAKRKWCMSYSGRRTLINASPTCWTSSFASSNCMSGEQCILSRPQKQNVSPRVGKSA